MNILVPAAIKVAPATSFDICNLSQIFSKTGTKKSSQMAPKAKIRYVAIKIWTIIPPLVRCSCVKKSGGNSSMAGGLQAVKEITINLTTKQKRDASSEKRKLQNRNQVVELCLSRRLQLQKSTFLKITYRNFRLEMFKQHYVDEVVHWFTYFYFLQPQYAICQYSVPT